MQVIELGEYLLCYLCDTELWERLAELCQTVEILFALLNVWTYNKKRVIWVKRIKSWLYDGRIKFWELVDLGLHLIDIVLVDGYPDALDKFVDCPGAILMINSFPLAKITLIQSTIAIEY